MPLKGDSTVLVPVDVSAAEPPAPGILDLLEPIHVVVLGYYPVPRQTAPAHLRETHGADAAAQLERVVADFETTGHAVEDVLVFTKDRQDSIDRVADQHDCDAVLTAGKTERIDRILVPLRGDVNLERIVSIVANLLHASAATATVFHSVADDGDADHADALLQRALADLVDRGIARDRLDYRLSEVGDPHGEVASLAGEHDLVVLGETEPSLRDRIIGSFLTRVIDETEIPVLVVRNIE